MTVNAELLLGYYGSLTLATFVLYAVDKRAARAGEMRVRERTLHLLALLGGFAGAIAGQWLLRHKRRHATFVLGAWLALILHAAAWGWWLA